MESLFWATAPALNSVHVQEEWVLQHKANIAGMLTTALRPAEEYLALFAQFHPLLELNVEAYVSNLDATGVELSEMRAAVKKHSAELALLEEMLPVGVSMGAVQVSCLKVKPGVVCKIAMFSSQ